VFFKAKLYLPCGKKIDGFVIRMIPTMENSVTTPKLAGIHVLLKNKKQKG